MSTFCRDLFVEQFQAAIRSAKSVDSTAALSRIAAFARRTVGADVAGFSIAQPDGRLRTLGETNHLMITMDEMQTQLQEGPGIELTTAESTDAVQCDSLREEDRWPRWCPLPAQLGFSTVLSVGIADHHGRPACAFTLYRTGGGFADGDVETVRAVLAEAAHLEQQAREQSLHRDESAPAS